MNLHDHGLDGDAKSIVEQANGELIILIGMPLGTGRLEKDDSPLVDSVCSSCGSPVQSSKKKEEILLMAKSMKAPAKLLCGKCIVPYLPDILLYRDS